MPICQGKSLLPREGTLRGTFPFMQDETGQDESGPLEADRQFFGALTGADVEALGQLLAGDFVLIDVMRGAEITKAQLLTAVGSGQVKFESIKPAESRVRLYPSTAVVTGRTEMSGFFAGTPFAASSRYTHVYVRREGRWRMVSAQGTRIAD